MKLYILRHGEALNAVEDTKRALSDTGIREVNVIADFLAHRQVKIDQIYHSGKLRAEQTAKVIAHRLALTPNLQQLSGLLPEDSIKPIAVYCNHWQQNVLLVGHLPSIARLVSELLFNQEDRPCLDFQTAAIVCLERIMTFQWSIAWFVHPALIENDQ